MGDIVAVFLRLTLEDNDNEKLNECHRMTRCGNLAPLQLSDSPSLRNFIGTRAVDWPDSETINETRLLEETDQGYETRMLIAVNIALADLQANRYEAAIMSDELFVNARGQG